MGLVQALEILTDIASRYGENAEEDFSQRLNAQSTDAEVKHVAENSEGYEVSDVTEIRDLWRAVEVAQKYINNAEKEKGGPVAQLDLDGLKKALFNSGYASDEIIASRLVEAVNGRATYQIDYYHADSYEDDKIEKGYIYVERKDDGKFYAEF